MLTKGNHEVWNVMGMLDYVTEGDTESFGGPEKREKAWSKDGWIGKYVRKLGMTVRINGTLFFHGGASPRWSKMGLETLQKMATEGLNDMSVEQM